MAERILTPEQIEKVRARAEEGFGWVPQFVSVTLASHEALRAERDAAVRARLCDKHYGGVNNESYGNDGCFVCLMNERDEARARIAELEAEVERLRVVERAFRVVQRNYAQVYGWPSHTTRGTNDGAEHYEPCPGCEIERGIDALEADR